MRPAPARTISDVLMGYSLELVLPDLAKPLEGGALRADLRLHNDVLEHLSYSNSKLSPQEKVVLDCMKETNLTRVEALYSQKELDPLVTTVMTREALTSASPIKTQYYWYIFLQCVITEVWVKKPLSMMMK